MLFIVEKNLMSAIRFAIATAIAICFLLIGGVHMWCACTTPRTAASTLGPT